MKQQTRATRAVLLAVAVALVLSAIIAIVFVIHGSFGQTQAKVLGTVGTLAGSSIAAFPVLTHLERSRYVPLATFGATVTFATTILIIVTIWNPSGFGIEEYAKSVVSIAIAAFTCNHISVLLFSQPRVQIVRRIRNTTVALSIVVATLIGFAIWLEVSTGAFWRPVSVLIILDVLGTLGTPVATRLVQSR